VIEVTSDGQQHSQQVQTNLTVNLTPKGRAADGLVNWRRASLRVGYTLSKVQNNSDGPFVVPPSGTLTTEWGPAPGDRRHRGNFSITSQALRNLNATFRVEGSTGSPYNVTTGLDNNGDLLFNDRPAGLGRNAVRTASQITTGLNVSYMIPLGPSRAGDDQGRYRLGLTVQIGNLTNRYNYSGYSGVMTSPFFLQPTAVNNPRKVDILINFAF
jgi:hypothetical protein